MVSDVADYTGRNTISGIAQRDRLQAGPSQLIPMERLHRRLEGFFDRRHPCNEDTSEMLDRLLRHCQVHPLVYLHWARENLNSPRRRHFLADTGKCVISASLRENKLVEEDWAINRIRSYVYGLDYVLTKE